MKPLSFITALLATVAPVCTAAGTDIVPPALQNFPGNGMRLNGESVTLTPTAEFIDMQKNLTTKLQQLSLEKKLEFLKNYSSTTLISYTTDFWPDPADYEKYKAEWKKIAVTPVQKVQVGIYNRGNNEWSLHGIAVNTFANKVTPLTICSLVYRADSNVWISANGELTPTEITTTSDNVYGARKGTAWVLKKEDALSRISETLTITRRTNGEYLYLTYDFSERTPGDGTMLAQGSYVLRFRIGPPAPDPESQAPQAEPATPQAPAPETIKAEQPREKAKSSDEPRRKKRRNRRRRRN
ncbi:MAG: hypothetical protein IJ943_06600 [Akkermansia sp.]|nr:hypothetical protein [Akkermansia sp.]